VSQSHASARAAPGPAASYRLRGEVGGVARVYPLAPGGNQIGSMAGNTIVLGVRGVSRRHARLTLDAEGLTLEDLGSKNGTMANGVRIQRTQLVPGDEVRIGPVLLRLEAVDAADTDLAIVLSRGETSPLVGLPAKDTTAVSTEEGSGLGLQVVEGVLARLAVRPAPDLTGGLGLLRRELGAQGAALFELARSGTVILASSGEVAELSLHRGLQDLARAAGGSAAAAVTAASFEGQNPLACALQGGPGDRLGLALWGKLSYGRTETERLLRVLLSLADLFRPRPLHNGTVRPAVRSLVFPEGYVPGDSTAMTSLYEQMKSLLQGDLPVLLLGETGVGKEYLSGILHASSARRAGPFVAVNCAAIPAELLESEMFGIRRGTATGVVERTGSFQRANGGTLLLDEIGEMPLALQAKLLRALQEKRVQPVGGELVAVDIRVIAATNSDLQRRMDAGLFRRDLYYRVAGFVLRVPALRERKEDVAGLVVAFVRGFARETGKAVRGVTEKALQALKDYAWPGNVRELQHEVRRLVYLCPDGQALESSMISEHILLAPQPVDPATGEIPASLELEPNLGRLESRLIREALGRAGGNRTQAARLLGISRNGLAIKMERLGIKDSAVGS
jgi:DNA-binding NtrC family response regulator